MHFNLKVIQKKQSQKEITEVFFYRLDIAAQKVVAKYKGEREAR